MVNTHMGQPPIQHVSLQSAGSGNNIIFARINADGTKNPFTIPVGNVFVVTDVDWIYSGGNHRRRQTLQISIQKIHSGDPEEDELEPERVFISTIMLDRDGQGGVSEAMTSGFVVSSAGRIVVDTEPGGGSVLICMRGYFTLES